MPRTKPISAASVLELRQMALTLALERLGYSWTEDLTFTSRADLLTKAFQIEGPTGSTRLIVTGLKWFDPAAAIGGFGALDLGIHLTKASFLRVARVLAASSRPVHR